MTIPFENEVQAVIYDDASGQMLNEELVQQARREEIEEI